MRTLVIESASEACSVALFDGQTRIAGTYQVIGRGHAEMLVPMIAELPGKGQADRILVSLGPGSFTGVRIGLAAARALGLAWGVPVLGYPTLALIAAMARGEHSFAVSVCITGGHGEWFVQDFGADGLAQGPLASLTAAAAATAARHDLVAGSKAGELVDLRGSGTALPLLPDANSMALLPPDLAGPSLTPLYGRAPDAKLPGGKSLPTALA